jgi:glycosyltransferase involved in cell wall biosynthesis
MVLEAARLLTFNCHDAYIHSLSSIGYQWDVVDHLPGRYISSWDSRIRPVPDNVRLIGLEECLRAKNKYHCIIAHNINDLLDVKSLPCPKILVLHVSLTGYVQQEGGVAEAAKMRSVLQLYLSRIGALCVAISPMKQKTWGVNGPIIPPYIDGDFFQGYHGAIASGLRVGNQFGNKNIILDWETHSAIANGFPLKLVGYNPDLPEVEPAGSWVELRNYYQNYRFYLHTAKYDYEDGYNLASLEAMATGMPVVCNWHPSSPIIDGVNGFMSRDAAELRERIKELLGDRRLAAKLGRAAREWVLDNHRQSDFIRRWHQAIDQAVEIFGLVS